METPRYVVDPSDPRAPAQDVWDRMSEAERRRVVHSLPSEVPRATPPDGDRHRVPKSQALEALDEFFRRRGRSVYLSSELPIYYPDEPMVRAGPRRGARRRPHPRDRWVVSDEGRGLDFVLEVHVSGDRRKDLEVNVERFARLGIPECFVLVPGQRLVGYTLGERGRQPIVPQRGTWRSDVLGMDLALEDGDVRFYVGTAPLPFGRELVDKLTAMVNGAVHRAQEEARRAQEEARRAQEEARRAQEEARRAEEQTERAERFAAKLRELGVDPDTLE